MWRNTSKMSGKLLRISVICQVMCDSLLCSFVSFLHLDTFQSHVPSLKLTFSHLKMDGWKTSFLLGQPIFWCYVGFRECIVLMPQHSNVTRGWCNQTIFFSFSAASAALLGVGNLSCQWFDVGHGSPSPRSFPRLNCALYSPASPFFLWRSNTFGLD